MLNIKLLAEKQNKTDLQKAWHLPNFVGRRFKKIYRLKKGCVCERWYIYTKINMHIHIYKAECVHTSERL